MTSFQKLIHLFAGPPVSSGTHLSDGSLRAVGQKYCHQSEANWHGLQSCTGQNLCRPTVGGTSIMGIWRTTTQPQYQAMHCNAPRNFNVTKVSDAQVNQSYWVFANCWGCSLDDWSTKRNTGHIWRCGLGFGFRQLPGAGYTGHIGQVEAMSARRKLQQVIKISQCWWIGTCWAQKDHMHSHYCNTIDFGIFSSHILSLSLMNLSLSV